MSRTEPSFEPALDDDVHLHGQPGGGGGVDPREHPRDREVDVVHRAEDLVVERVEAHGDPREAGVGERLRLLREEGRVRRQRDVEAVVDAGERSIRSSRSRRRSGSPPVIRSFRTPSSTNARATRSISSKVEELAPRQEPVLAAEDLLRHAVDAAEVAAVGDRDPQIAHGPAERVGRRSSRRSVENPRGAPARALSSRSSASPRSGASRSSRCRTRSRSTRSSRSSPCGSRSRPSPLRPSRGARCGALPRAGLVAGVGVGALLARGVRRCRPPGSSARRSRARASSPACTSCSRRCSRSPSSEPRCRARSGSASRSPSSGFSS